LMRTNFGGDIARVQLRRNVMPVIEHGNNTKPEVFCNNRGGRQLVNVWSAVASR